MQAARGKMPTVFMTSCAFIRAKSELNSSSNCSWKGGELTVSLRQPFDLLAETSAIEVQAAREGRPNLAKTEIWLPFLDTYRTMCLAPEPAFRRILEGIRDLRFAA
jgi:hypothetical protein